MKKDLKDNSQSRIMHDTWADYEPPSFFKPRIYISSMEYDSEGNREDFIEHEYYENDELFYAGEEEGEDESFFILENEGNPPLTEEQKDYFGSSYNIKPESNDWAPVYERIVHKDEFFAGYYDSHSDAEGDYLGDFRYRDEIEDYDAYLHQSYDDGFLDELPPIDRVIRQCREYNRTKSTSLNLSNTNITKYIVAYPTFWDFSSMIELNISSNNIQYLDNLPPNLINLICDCNYNLKSLDNLPETLLNLSCKNGQIKALDNLPMGLRTLDCTNNDIKYLNNLPKELDVLHCSNNPIERLSGLPFLSVLNASNCKLYEIDLPITVRRVNVSNNKLICIWLKPFLQELDCSMNKIERLFFPTDSIITFLNCCQNNIKSFKFDPPYYKCCINLPKTLFTLKCCNNLLTNLDLEGSELRELHCCHNPLKNLDLPPDLLELACDNTQITKLVMSKRLEKVSCVNNKLTTIQFSKITHLRCDTSLFMFDHNFPDSITNISESLCRYNECSINYPHDDEFDEIPPPPPRKLTIANRHKRLLSSDDIHDPYSELRQLEHCTDLDKESSSKIQTLLTTISFEKRWNEPFNKFVRKIQYAHVEIEKLKQLIIGRRTALFKDELQEVALHPSRIEKLIKMGFSQEDLEKII